MDLHRSAIVVGSLTLLSRITGLLREVVQAWFLGTGMGGDAFRVAFLLPNLLRRLVGEGAVTSAFVPVYAGYLEGDGERKGRVFAEKFLTFWVTVVALFTVAGVVLAGWAVPLTFGRGSFSQPEKLELTVSLTRVLFWYLLLIGGVAAVQGILQARGLFGAASFSPVAFNLVFVGAAFLLVPLLGEGRAPLAMALAVLVSGMAQLLVLVPPLVRAGIRLRPRYPFDDPGVRGVMRLLVPGTIGAGVYQVNVVFSMAFAARLEEGAVSSLGYSNRLMEFVLGISVFALGTVGLTALSRHHAAGERAAFETTLAESLRLATFISVPSMVGLYLLRRPIIALLFQRGEFDAASVELTAAAFRFHVLGLVFVGWNRLLVAALHARKDLKTPVVQAACNMGVNLFLAWELSAGPLRHAGIALASTVAAPCLTLPLLWVLLRRLPGLRLDGVLRTAFRTLAASAVMGAVCWGGMEWLWSPATKSKIAEAGVVAVLIVVGVGTFFAAAWVLGLEEGGMLFRAMRRRRQGS